MDCEQITQVSTALAIMQAPPDTRLEKLFHCIYSMFLGSFLKFILNRYSNNTILRERLLENAKDAFQNGILAFYDKGKKNELNIKGSLKTTVYSFGRLQLLAIFKKDKIILGKDQFFESIDLWLDDESKENERQLFLNEREKILMGELRKLPLRQREIIIMKFFKNLSSKEIATKLGVTPGYVDNISTRVYKEMRKILMVKSNYVK